jgi:hypothetical protein
MSSEQQQHFKERFPKLKNMTDKEIAVELVKIGERENKRVSEIEKWIVTEIVEDDLKRKKLTNPALTVAYSHPSYTSGYIS